jgi:Fe-S-cluster containining protein
MSPHVLLNSIASTEDPNSLHEFCSVCPKTTHCCFRASTIVVLPKEAETISQRTMSSELLQKEEDGLFTIVKKSGEACPFLTANGLCGIYDIRPIDCRSWPLTLNKELKPEKYVMDAACLAVQNGGLSRDFIQASKIVLSHIEPTSRNSFIRLVHRDNLPLKAFGEPPSGADNDDYSEPTR